jgi:hypothetical protein
MGVGSGGEPPGGGSGPDITPGGASFRRPVVETAFTRVGESPFVLSVPNYVYE